ncbi:MAG: hypothetical protein QNJ68_09790 [Microcoleaceae cyanobacterium MO_207.B10]|nr:hypothetical protein [Microcoleaceae cyanobacterium MO_207.B10]
MTPIPELHPNSLLLPPYSLSPDDLADILGVSPYTIDNWKYKKRSPKPVVKKFCYLLSQNLEFVKGNSIHGMKFLL